MPAHCCVLNCRSNALRDKERFFRIPAIRHFTHKHRLNELSEIRRQKWIDAIKRKDFTKNVLKYATVCSRHFITGEPAKLEDDSHPDWIPSKNMGFDELDDAYASTKLSSFGRKNKRPKLAAQGFVEEVSEVSTLEEPIDRAEENVCPNIEVQTDLNISDIEVSTLEEPIDRAEENVCPNIEVQTDLNISDTEVSTLEEPIDQAEENFNSNIEVQTDLNIADLSLLFAKISNDLKIFQERSLCCTNLKNDDSKIKYYTGLSNYKTFEIVVNCITPFIKIYGENNLEPQEQILLTLVKLRLNLDFKDISYRFGITPSTASTYFKNILKIMFLRLKSSIIWPERSVLLKNMPQCFKESFHDNTTVIIDFFEIPCETLLDLVPAAKAWSNYKHPLTVKYLIAITPQGTISFISQRLGGSSDKCLIQNSKFLNNLCPGNFVLADRGFLIKEFVDIFHKTIKNPAFIMGKSQLDPVNLAEKRAIPQVKIHVERIIGIIRQKYRIMRGPVSVSLMSTCGDEEALLDEIVTVCCSLINLCPPIVPL